MVKEGNSGVAGCMTGIIIIEHLISETNQIFHQNISTYIFDTQS